MAVLQQSLGQALGAAADPDDGDALLALVDLEVRLQSKILFC